MDIQRILRSDEKAIAQRYNLNNFFVEHENLLQFVAEIRNILDKRFNGFSQTNWAKNKCSDFIQEFLQYNDSLYSYVNDIFAAKNDFKNMPSEDWIIICKVCSKIIVHLGWNYDT
ncbi:MAG: hypothetical protein D4S01_00665 [Dehalococcoidia bacterium]|nr:MAG: hypothetical protein D4S01_00665 [Dehalococcoidia bacterium]